MVNHNDQSALELLRSIKDYLEPDSAPEAERKNARECAAALESKLIEAEVKYSELGMLLFWPRCKSGGPIPWAMTEEVGCKAGAPIPSEGIGCKAGGPIPEGLGCRAGGPIPEGEG